MQYTLERQLTMACGNEDCHSWDDTYEQNCSKVSSSSEPTPSTCPTYRPDEEAYPKLA